MMAPSGTLSIRKSPSGSANDLFPTGQHGYYVFNATRDQVSGACVTVSYPVYLGNLSWRTTPNNGSWSVPQQITAISAAYTTYMTCYSVAWADIAATSAHPAATMATSYPDFTATSSMACRDNSVPIVITRTVVVQGKTISFERAIDIPFN